MAKSDQWQQDERDIWYSQQTLDLKLVILARGILRASPAIAVSIDGAVALGLTKIDLEFKRYIFLYFRSLILIHSNTAISESFARMLLEEIHEVTTLFNTRLTLSSFGASVETRTPITRMLVVFNSMSNYFKLKFLRSEIPQLSIVGIEMPLSAYNGQLHVDHDRDPVLGLSADIAFLVEQKQNWYKLVDIPLWPKETPRSILQYWTVKSMQLERFGQGWEVWIDWIDAILEGNPLFGLPTSISKNLEARIAVGDNRPDFWNRAPGIINAEIASWVEEVRRQIIHPSDESLILKIEGSNQPSAGTAFTSAGFGGVEAKGEVGGLSFESQSFPIKLQIEQQEKEVRAQEIGNARLMPNEFEVPSETDLQQPYQVTSRFVTLSSGQITLDADPLNAMAGRKRDDMQELYEDALVSVAVLHGLGSNKLGKCSEPVENLIIYMPEQFAGVSINRLWSRANVLRDIAAQHGDELGKLAIDRDLNLILDSDTFVKLETCVRQLNVLIAFDERGRELDRLSFGPEVRKRDEVQIAAATPIIQNIFHVADQATVNVLQGDHNSVPQAGHNIHGDQALERVAGQELNLVATILLASRRIAVQLSDTPLSAETVTQVAVSAGGQFGPQILKFVAEHQDSFSTMIQHMGNVVTINEFLAFVVMLGSYLVSKKTIN